jgi:hypothetical protein
MTPALIAIGFPLDPALEGEWEYVTAVASESDRISTLNGTPWNPPLNSGSFLVGKCARDFLAHQHYTFRYFSRKSAEFPPSEGHWGGLSDTAAAALALARQPVSLPGDAPVLLISCACNFPPGFGLRGELAPIPGATAESLGHKWGAVKANRKIIGLVLVKQDADLLKSHLERKGEGVFQPISLTSGIIATLVERSSPAIVSCESDQLPLLAAELGIQPAFFECGSPAVGPASQAPLGLDSPRTAVANAVNGFGEPPKPGHVRGLVLGIVLLLCAAVALIPSLRERAIALFSPSPPHSSGPSCEALIAEIDLDAPAKSLHKVLTEADTMSEVSRLTCFLKSLRNANERGALPRVVFGVNGVFRLGRERLYFPELARAVLGAISGEFDSNEAYAIYSHYYSPLDLADLRRLKVGTDSDAFSGYSKRLRAVDSWLEHLANPRAIGWGWTPPWIGKEGRLVTEEGDWLTTLVGEWQKIQYTMHGSLSGGIWESKDREILDEMRVPGWKTAVTARNWTGALLGGRYAALVRRQTPVVKGGPIPFEFSPCVAGSSDADRSCFAQGSDRCVDGICVTDADDATWELRNKYGTWGDD